MIRESQDNFLHLLTPQQITWCNAHIVSEWKVNERGEVYTFTGNIALKDRVFQRFEVQFADIEGFFDCEGCLNLLSLKGAPKKVGRHFYCNRCTQLLSLEGGPEEVGGNYYCHDCLNLINLVGSPKKVNSFYCNFCKSLITLKGANTVVNEDFYCNECPNLVSLKGAPESVSRFFDCSHCPNLTSLEGAPREINGKFDCNDCPKLNPKEVELTKDKKLFKIWLKAGTPPIDEFLDPRGKWRGVVTGSKFGI